MIHTDRKPGVKLVTDPPKREPKLTLRIRETDADLILSLVQLGAQQVRLRTPWLSDETTAKVGRFDAAVRKAREPRNVNF